MSKLTDQIAFVRLLTPKKVWNGLALLISYYFSRILKKPVHWGMPISLNIEPTTACNLGCPECPSGLKKFTRPTGNLKNDSYISFLNQLKDYVAYITFYFQGEPFINPQFLEMVRYANSLNIYTATSTNAHFLHSDLAKKTVESGLNRLIISIDGTTQEVYENYRVNGSLEKVLGGTKNILYWKKQLKSKTPHVIFQFLVVQPNEHQIDDVYALANELGVDEVRLKTAQIYDYQNGSPLIPKNEKYSRYTRLPNGSYRIQNKLLNQCWKMWHSCVLTWDGLVVPCCFDKDAQHQMGDLKETPFREVWRNGAYNSFRKALLTSRSEIEICKNCTVGTKVWVED